MLNKNSNIMKSKLFFLALSAMALATSCSNDEVTELSDSNAIKYAATAGKMTRASEAFCNNELPTTIQLYAQSGSKKFIDDLTLTRDGSSTNYKNDAVTHFWPENAVTFYGLVNNENAGKGTWNFAATGAPSITGYTVSETPASQKDLIYAVAANQTKADNSGTVELNFRHALAQMIFRAKNTSDALYIKVKSVKVGNLNTTGNFTFPSTSTTPNYINHTGDVTGTAPSDGTTNWASLSNPKSYEFTGLNKEVLRKGTDDNVTWLTGNSIYGDDATGKATTLMLIPQSTTAANAWSAVNNDGNCFILDVEAYNIAKPDATDANGGFAGTDNEVEIHNGKLVVPIVDMTWNQGYRYIYTFVFGTDGSGKDPDDPENPVFVSIKYTVTVDDFVPSEENEIDMKVNNPTDDNNSDE